MPRPEWSFFMLPEDHKEVKWTQSYLQAKFTVWGQIIFGMTFVGMAVSSVGTQTCAYFFVALVWALFFTSLLLSWFFKPTITLSQYLPPTPTAGGVCLCRVIVSNTGRRPLRNVEIFYHKLPYGLYALPDHPKHHAFIDWLDPGKKTTLTMALRIPRRGSFIIEPLLAGTSFPSGLMRSLKRATERTPFIVLPKLLHLNVPLLPLKQQLRTGGSNTNSTFGSSNEFLSTREYRDGDRPRDIHWNSSAKAGKLIVKEYINENFIQMGLFLDTELKRFEKHLCFETRIALCAGVAEDLHKNNYCVNLFLSDPLSPAVQVQGNKDGFGHFLKILSSVEGREHVDLAQPLGAINKQSAGLSELILFLKDWDAPRSAFVRTLRLSNIPTRILIIRDKPLTLPVNDPQVSVYTPQQLGFNL